MAKASGSRVSFNVGKETTLGTPATSLQKLKNITVGESLNSSATELQSNAITEIRDIAGLRNGLYSVSGSLGAEIATEGCDILFESLMGGKTSTGTGPYVKTYRRASVVPSLTLERVYSGTSPLMTQVYTGVKINQMQFTFEPGSLVTASTDIIGVKSLKGTAVIDSIPDEYNHIPFAGIDATTIKINGVTAKVIKGTLTISNGIEASNVLGSQYADDVVEGKGEVSGEFDLYFENRTYYDLFDNETIFAVELTLTRGTDTVKFNIPKAKFSGNRDVPVSTDKALIATYTFKGIQDASINGAVEIIVSNANA